MTKKDIFFNQIRVPEFVSSIFDKEEWYLEIGNFRQLIKDNFTGIINGSMSGNYVINGDNVYIGNNCNIGDFVVIEGPAYIGNNVEISSGVLIRAGSIISDNCQIAHAAEIKNTLMMEESKLANHVFAGDSILGYKSRMGGHSETGNRRFNQGNIPISFENEVIDSQMDKYGIILGEGSRMGGAVISAPGTTVGKNSFIDSGTAIKKAIGANKFVKNKSQIEVTDNTFDGELDSSESFFNKD